MIAEDAPVVGQSPKRTKWRALVGVRLEPGMRVADRCIGDALTMEYSYFFFAPARARLLIASGARPDFSAISRSCSMM